jgi:hypothetical protein
MHISHFKAQVGADFEALLSEINELKKRVTDLEHKQFHLEIKNMGSFTKYEYIGSWNHKKIEDKTKVTCNTSEVV